MANRRLTLTKMRKTHPDIIKLIKHFPIRILRVGADLAESTVFASCLPELTCRVKLVPDSSTGSLGALYNVPHPKK